MSTPLAGLPRAGSGISDPCNGIAEPERVASDPAGTARRSHMADSRWREQLAMYAQHRWVGSRNISEVPEVYEPRPSHCLRRCTLCHALFRRCELLKSVCRADKATRGKPSTVVPGPAERVRRWQAWAPPSQAADKR
eukprot:10084371-Alexandrium_andersonii.AAC.1